MKNDRDNDDTHMNKQIKNTKAHLLNWAFFNFVNGILFVDVYDTLFNNCFNYHALVLVNEYYWDVGDDYRQNTNG